MNISCLFYKRDGTEMECEDWINRFERDPSYKRVSWTRVPKTKKWISTIWLGLDHQYGDGPPLIFETMVFNGSASPIACRRYTSEKEAIAGHAVIVRQYMVNRAMRRRKKGTGDGQN